MRQSQLFTKIEKTPPKDEESLNAKLLTQAGFVQKLMAGVYTFLPLGLRVLNKIENIVREEMNNAGGKETLMPALHPLENYIKTGRDKIDVLFHIESATGKKMVLGQSHEEVVVPLAKQFVSSYRDLPLAIYQIQTKFRNELRAKSGLFRGIEFRMKDMYSFHRDEKDFENFYKKMQKVYTSVFERAGIGEKTYLTQASGGTFSKYSEEFQALTSSGEDTIYICDKCRIAINDEIIGEYNKCQTCGNDKLRREKSIEVGNIFPLKTKYSEPFGLVFKDEEGKNKPVIMGCYGIGMSRLMGAIAEIKNDENGLIWPKSVAPFAIHLISLGDGEKVKDDSAKIYDNLLSKGIEVLYDDRNGKSAGEKFAESDLIGIPLRIVVSERTLEKGSAELKRREDKESKLVKISELFGAV